jgi:hypothetical protein
MALILRLLPSVLCALVMAAHAMRSAWGPVAVAALALSPVAFLVRRPLVPLAARVLLVAGALEWLRTARAYSLERAALGQPSARLWLILGSVAAIHLVAAALLSGERVRAWFRRPAA